MVTGPVKAAAMGTARRRAVKTLRICAVRKGGRRAKRGQGPQTRPDASQKDRYARHPLAPGWQRGAGALSHAPCPLKRRIDTGAGPRAGSAHARARHYLDCLRGLAQKSLVSSSLDHVTC